MAEQSALNGNDGSDQRNGADQRTHEAEPTATKILDAALRAAVGAAEIGDHVALLLRVHADRMRSAAVRGVAKALIGALLFVGLAVAVGAASLRAVAGMAGAFEALFGSREWAGNLVGGLATLVTLGGGLALAWKAHSHKEFRKKEAEYEQLRRRHAERFGDDTDREIAPAAK